MEPIKLRFSSGIRSIGFKCSYFPHKKGVCAVAILYRLLRAFVSLSLVPLPDMDSFNMTSTGIITGGAQ